MFFFRPNEISEANVNIQDISVNHPLQQKNVASPLANESNISFATEVDVRSGEGVNSPPHQLAIASLDKSVKHLKKCI